MTIEEVVKRVLLEEQADVLRSAVEAVCAQLMEVEVSQLVGAKRGERRPEGRATHRNGYRAREWQTRAGRLELQIPKMRRGSYFPSFLEPRRRSEQALLAVIEQCYVCGVSTRRVDQLVESLGLRVSKSELSRICGALVEHVDAFRSRPLEGRYAAHELSPTRRQHLEAEKRPPFPAASRQPSAGLEPATPSLPWRSGHRGEPS